MVTLGLLFHALGGFAAGAFYAPTKKVQRWAWESYWLALGIFAWIVVPLIVASLTVPSFATVLLAAPLRPLALSFMFGILWGIGSVTFGLSVRYLGMSLGFAISLGFCAAFGTLIPPLFDGSIWEILRTTAGWLTLGGIALCLVGISVCGRAGVIKEAYLLQKESQIGHPSAGDDAREEFRFVRGVIVAVFAGAMSACMAFAFKAGAPVQELAVEMGVPAVRSNVPLLVVILWGGFVTNAIWCAVLAKRKHSFSDFTNRSKPRLRNWLLCAVAGTLWYFQFFFYGMGETQMGEYKFTSWSLHMAFIIATSNLLGLAMGEWRHCGRKALAWLYGGTAILVLATVVIGIGGTLAAH
jgi:L-rhamnose-H+ transport protein